MKIHLELCPCCGDYAFLMNDTNSLANYYGLPCWFVMCHGCGLRTQKGEKEEVIRDWNRRVYNGITEAIDTLETEMD